MSQELRELSGTSYELMKVRDAAFHWIDLSGAEVRHAGLRNLRLRGVEIEDVEIDGELMNVVVNGVDIGPLVEAELTRRDPEYAAMKPTDAVGFRAAWEILERRWAATVARAQALDPALVHEQVHGEWSFVQTLRHLCYATDAWIGRVYLGDPDPWSPLDLPFDTLRDLEWPHPRDVRPELDEVLELRADRQATVRRALADLTDERLAEHTSPVEGAGWPPADSYAVLEVFSIVVNEEWQHNRFAERDLAVLESRT